MKCILRVLCKGLPWDWIKLTSSMLTKYLVSNYGPDWCTFYVCGGEQGGGTVWIIRCLTNIGITMLKVRRSHDRRTFKMGIPYLKRRSLYWNGTLSPNSMENTYLFVTIRIPCTSIRQTGRRLTTRSHKISKPWDMVRGLYNYCGGA